MPAYLDHAASTPVRPEVVDAVVPWLADHRGNPSGSHTGARAARKALDEAREAVAALVGAEPGEVVFTSGGTEADNAAVHGRAARGPAGAGEPPAGTLRWGRVLCSAIEHHAVLDPVRARGGEVVAVDACGRLDLGDLERRLTGGEPPALVSVMLANNETGVVQDLDAVAAVVAEHAPNTPLHTDAVQAAPWLDLTTSVAPAALVSLSAHKIGGPTGAGALVVREGTALVPLLEGGGQERGLRSGTPNVPGIVGLGTAARILAEEREAVAARVGALRDALLDGLVAAVPDLHVTPAAPRVPGIAHVCIEGVDSESLLLLLDREGVAASAASSCSAGALEPSHVLAALGIDDELAGGSLRLSLGWSSTEADVEAALAVVPPAVEQLRRLL